ncbi:B3/4 domain-containing protein [Pseudoclavibacter sp. VKM Ac-2867]|uniref:B3/B4 domain-containing protein n=1 Tax=Pseudoclavibacter sp. VKM Ac-2867 TaxID=2783829 RepID=UPI001E54C198|nr:phenylalanine--tRNA ligase beta subunit-related protein [Pseudoclavibacter sp. VKM Ac-2867]
MRVRSSGPRFKKESARPSIHPLVDLCNAVSIAYAIPIAVFDLDHVDGNLTVRHANGTETYATFSGDTEHPEPGDVIYADDANKARARRWTNRQSALSAIRQTTTRVLIVSEAMHDTGTQDVAALKAGLTEALGRYWHIPA